MRQLIEDLRAFGWPVLIMALAMAGLTFCAFWPATQ